MKYHKKGKSLSIEDAVSKTLKTIHAVERPQGVTRRELTDILGLSAGKKRDYRSAQQWIDVIGNHVPVIEVGEREAVGCGGNPSTVYGLMK